MLKDTLGICVEFIIIIIFCMHTGGSFSDVTEQYKKN